MAVVLDRHAHWSFTYGGVYPAGVRVPGEGVVLVAKGPDQELLTGCGIVFVGLLLFAALFLWVVL